MAIILAIVFIIVIGVSLGFIILHSKIIDNFNRKTVRLIEYWGYIILFIVISIQVFVSEFMLADFSKPDLYVIDTKLDVIYSALKTAEYGIANNNSYYYEIHNQVEDSSRQVEWSNLISLILGALSSVLIAVGRLYEISPANSEKGGEK